MLDLQDRYPEKIRIFKNTNKGVAMTKNLGVEKARANYIAFVDSDDYVDYKMLERLYAATKDGQMEMVVSPIWKIDGTKRSVIGSVKTTSVGDTILPYLQSGSFYLHGKLFRRDLFDTYGLLPHLSKAEDLGWLYPTISYLKNIAYVTTPGYYYEYSDNSVCRQTGNVKTVKDSLLAGDIILEKANPLYRADAIRYVFGRVPNIRQQYPVFTYLFDEWVIEHQEVLYSLGDEKTLSAGSKQDQKIISFLSDKLNAAEHQIPGIVYINGVGQEPDAGFVQMCHTAFQADDPGKADEEDHRVVILSEADCSLSDVPVIAKALEQKQYDFVGKYLAVKACYEHGGIFIDGSMVIDAPLDAVKYDQNVFSFEGTEVFTDRFFGCAAGSVVFQRILDTYKVADLNEDEFEPLSSRIKTVMTGLYEISCVNPHRKTRYRNTIAFYPMNSIICNMEGVAEVQFMHCGPIQDAVDRAVSEKSPVISLLETSLQSAAAGKKAQTGTNDSDTVRKLREELHRIQSSKSWKLVEAYWAYRDQVVRRFTRKKNRKKS